ncbi:MAG TPA: RDD family protein [Acidimicrobiales bacterium]
MRGPGWYVLGKTARRGSPVRVGEGAALSTDRPLSESGRDEHSAPASRGPAGWAEPRSAQWRDRRSGGVAGTQAGPVDEEPPPRQALLAHWGLRVASYLVDFVAPFLAAAILVRVWAPAGFVAYVVAVAFVVWNLVVQGVTGQSVGKRLVGTMLVRQDDGEVVGPWLSIVRYLAHIVDVLPLYAGFLWPLWDHKRQTFSDKLCHTVVIVA